MSVRYIISVAIIGFTILNSCSVPPAGEKKYLSPASIKSDNPVLVSIDNEVNIRASELVIRLQNSNLAPAGGLIPWSQARDTLEEIILDSLINLAADTISFERDHAIQRDYRSVYEGMLQQEYITEVVYPQLTLDSAEVVDFYHSRPDLFTYFSQANVGHIVLSKRGYRVSEDSVYYGAMPDDRLDSLIIYRLKVLKEQLTDSLSFQEAAELYSQDRMSGERGGKLGWMDQGSLHPEIEDVLYDSSTALYEPIGPVKSRDGTHLFFLYGRHFEGIPPLNRNRFADAMNMMANEKAQSVMIRIFDSLYKEHPVVYNDSALMLSDKEADPNLWVAWVAGPDSVRHGRFYRELIGWSAMRGSDVNPTLLQRRVIISGLVNLNHIFRMCRELGILELPRVKALERSLRRDMGAILIRRLRSGSAYTPSDQEIETYYNAHLRDFINSSPYYVQQIIFKDSLKAEYVRSLAESGYDFLDLAQEHYPGEPDIRRAAADLGFVGPRDPIPLPVLTRIKLLTRLEISEPIKSELGFHVLKLVEYKKSYTVDEAKGQIGEILKSAHHEKTRRGWDSALKRRRGIWRSRVRYSGVLLGPKTERYAVPDPQADTVLP